MKIRGICSCFLAFKYLPCIMPLIHQIKAFWKKIVNFLALFWHLKMLKTTLLWENHGASRSIPLGISLFWVKRPYPSTLSLTEWYFACKANIFHRPSLRSFRRLVQGINGSEIRLHNGAWQHIYNFGKWNHSNWQRKLGWQ